MPVRTALTCVAFVLCTGCAGHPADGSDGGTSARSTGDTEWFSDRTTASGIDFVHVNGMSGEFYIPEILAPGVALFDYDNDGDLDVYLVQGQTLATGSTLPRQSGDRLYRNDLQVNADGTRTLHFTDITAESRIVSRGYGMGVATADIDNDGWIDLFVTKFDAPNQLFRNNHDGTFTDVPKSGLADTASWSVSAAFVDIDRDGWLDLFVGNYLRYPLGTITRCYSPSGALDYCTPRGYEALPGRLYRNRGNGTFVDVTARAGVGREFGPALGVVTADFDGDGWMDIYVANDTKENQLWMNRHDGTFSNVALLAGVALPVDGKAEASMGVDAGDFDNDGDEDLFMTELTGEGANLYVNDGTGTFHDRSGQLGVGPATVSYTGFGTAWVDVDNDGWLDLLTVNGAVQTIQRLAQAGDRFPFHLHKQLFRNLRGERFEDVTGRAGAVFAMSEVSRGAAFGDIDNDGDVDVLVANNNGPARLLINNIGARQHWLGLRLVGAREHRDMLGARVEVVRRDGSTLWRRVKTDGSYGSAHDPRVLAGLGRSSEPVTVRVHWPDGKVEQWDNLPVDRYATLTQGTRK